LGHHYIVNNVKMGQFCVDWKAYSIASLEVSALYEASLGYN